MKEPFKATFDHGQRLTRTLKDHILYIERRFPRLETTQVDPKGFDNYGS